VAIPAIGLDSDITVALIAEFALILMAVHTGIGQAHGVGFHIPCKIGPSPFADNGFFPIGQKILMDNPNDLLWLDAFLPVDRGLGCRRIAWLSVNGVMPCRISHNGKKNDQSEDDLAHIVHNLTHNSDTGLRKTNIPGYELHKLEPWRELAAALRVLLWALSFEL